MRYIIILLVVFLLVFFVSMRKEESFYFTLPKIVDPTISPTQKGSTPQKIPYVIVRSFATANIPDILKKSVKSTYDYNPEYKHIFFDDNDCYEFMHREYLGRVADAYDKLIPGAYKSDLFRICYLYKYGGVYFDVNKVLMVPLDKLFDSNYDLVTVVDKPDEFVWQAFFACKPRLPVVKLCIDKIVENVENRNYGNNALDITGPMMMGRVFKQYYGEGVLNPGIYRKRGELIKLLRQDGTYAKDDKQTKIIDLNQEIKSEINNAMEKMTSNVYYVIAWRIGKVYVDDP